MLYFHLIAIIIIICFIYLRGLFNKTKENQYATFNSNDFVISNKNVQGIRLNENKDRIDQGEWLLI